MDKIFINNIHTQAIIGIYDSEKQEPQKLIISVELGTDITKAAQTDDIKNTLDYDLISKFIDDYITKSKFELIETLAENLISNLFLNFDIYTIKLCLEKPEAIKLTKNVGIKIYRERK